MTTTWLGKITSAEFGFGGYDDAMFGLSLTFQGGGVGICDFIGTWATWSEGCKWSMDDQADVFAETVNRLRDTLKAAKCKHVGELIGVPVEVTIDGNRLKSWRVLEEVI